MKPKRTRPRTDLTQRNGDIHVAVLMGGPSSEADVSRKSGAAVAKALAAEGFRVAAVDFKEAALPPLPAGVQVVFPALHGHFGEDGQLQALLAAAGLPFVGSDAAASRLIMDKQATKDALAAAGLPIIPGVLLTDPAAPLPAALGLPLIVKPNREGSTIGLTKVDAPAQWPAALALALKFGGGAVVERFVVGHECTVGLLDGQPLPVVQMVPPGDVYDYDAKYTYKLGPTLYFCPPRDLAAATQAELQRLAAASFRALGARDLLRMDFLVDKRDGTPWILEGNSIPGFTDASLLPKAAAAAGIPFGALCARLVRAALARGAR